jgi:hypothetical protein
MDGNTRRLLVLTVLGIAFACLTADVAAAGAEPAGLPDLPPDCWGVYSWCSWNPRRITRQSCPNIVGAPIVLHWRSLEPAEGEYQFDKLLGERLNLARDNGFYTFAMIWVGPASPQWLYEKGVPRVRTDGKSWTFPYYFDPTYQQCFFRLVREFGRYVRALPDDLRRRIIFVQACEGSTGDGYCYKGKPLEAKYAISRQQWGKFRIRSWEVFKEAFQEGDRPAVRLLVNDDSSKGEQHEWLMKNLGDFGCKQGMFSHGYHISDARDRLARWRAFATEAAKSGRLIFTRGEMDAEWQRSGWSRKNLQQSLYWSALYATHCGLDLWNVPGEACLGQTYAPAIRFFNKYAGKRDPATSPAAFCALRRGLDASDTEAFPEARFGKASRRNVDRYVAIAKAFADRGAVQGDPPAATRGGMVNRGRKDYNDVGWGILRGNYERFLTQVEPEKTSVGLWHVGPACHHFGRFARAFDHKQGKTQMRFRLDPRFFAATAHRSARVRVIYLDRGRGTWALKCGGSGDERMMMTVRCRDSGQWLEKETTVEGARPGDRPTTPFDLALQHVSGDDTAFHMIELERLPSSAAVTDSRSP